MAKIGRPVGSFKPAHDRARRVDMTISSGLAEKFRAMNINMSKAVSDQILEWLPRPKDVERANLKNGDMATRMVMTLTPDAYRSLRSHCEKHNIPASNVVACLISKILNSSV